MSATQDDGDLAVKLANAGENVKKATVALSNSEMYVEKILKLLQEAEDSLGSQQLTGNIKDFKSAVGSARDKGKLVTAISSERMRPSIQSVEKLLLAYTDKKQLTSSDIQQGAMKVEEVGELSKDFCQGLEEFQQRLEEIEKPATAVERDMKAKADPVEEKRTTNRIVGGVAVAALTVPVAAFAAATTTPAVVPAAVAAYFTGNAAVVSGVLAAATGIFVYKREVNFSEKLQQLRGIIRALNDSVKELRESAAKVKEAVTLTADSIKRLTQVLKSLEAITADKKKLEEQKMMLDEKDAYIKQLEALVLAKQQQQ